jgi:hypothetical protein
LGSSQGVLFLNGLSFSFSSWEEEKETKVNPDQIRRQRESFVRGREKKLDLRGCATASDYRRLPQIIQQVFRSGPLPKAALSGFARRPAGP